MISLPHDLYLNAVTTALTDVGMDPADAWTSDADTRGLHCYLAAAITLTPEDSGISPDRWPEGLLLLWEWHPGVEEGEAERGPIWLWAKLRGDGSNTPPAALPVDGYANPVQVAATAHELAETGRAVKVRPGVWDGARDLDARVNAWAGLPADVAEAGEGR